MSASPRKSGGGFTLVELMVSLAILGLVLLGAQRLLAAARAGGDAIRAARVETERPRNAARWLRAAFESLRVGVDGDDSFRGGTDTLEFSSRLQTPEGGFEVERLQLTLEGGHVVARLGQGGPTGITLYRDAAGLEFHYLEGLGARSEWLRRWYSPATAPLAVRMILSGRDTLLFLVGPRA
jgi:prepilin-type N-terminal cleavage/methylation domain-containing protein